MPNIEILARFAAHLTFIPISGLASVATRTRRIFSLLLVILIRSADSVILLEGTELVHNLASILVSLLIISKTNPRF